MPDGREPTKVDVLAAMKDVTAADWDACAAGATPGNPFISHGFLSALEDSGSATAETGWLPRHLVVRDELGRLVAAAPFYLKRHSYGEYVFDWGWADAYERAGGRYYPKLISAVPFTPVAGRRLLVRGDLPAPLADELEDALARAMVTLAERLGVSSVHVNFPSQGEWRRLGAHGFLARTGQQFHWLNKGYKTFDDFLNDLASRKRKAIRKERRAVAEAGLDIRALTGPDITESHWDAFFRFYQATIDRKWGPGYLTRAFFSLLGERLGDRVVLIFARDASGKPVAGALNLVGGGVLYGRNWGATKRYDFLHFEACYYQAIDYAIRHGLSRVEAGAQGPHKVQRGYLPSPTYSAHWIADPGFRAAVERFLAGERRETEWEMREHARHAPFRRGQATENTDENGDA
jgi:hypothetical protein